MLTLKQQNNFVSLQVAAKETELENAKKMFELQDKARLAALTRDKNVIEAAIKRKERDAHDAIVCRLSLSFACVCDDLFWCHCRSEL